MSAAVGREPMAFAKLATRRDVIQTFYITDEYVKAQDENGNPTEISVILGRSPTGQMGHTDKHVFDSDFQIGDRMKISKKHAMVYWSHEEENWYIKSICKNAVKVDGHTYSGSPSGAEGKPAKLQSKSQIEIADGTPIFFLLPKGKSSPTEKPKQTYEQLIISVLPAGRGARPQRVSPAMAVLTCSMPTPQVLEGGQSLTLQDIILRIQEKYPYYAEEAQADSQTWKGSLRTTLNTKSKTFEKTNKVDSAAGKKVMYWSMRKGDAMDDGGASQGEGGMDVSASMPPDGVNPEVVHEPPLPPSEMQTDPPHM